MIPQHGSFSAPQRGNPGLTRDYVEVLIEKAHNGTLTNDEGRSLKDAARDPKLKSFALNRFCEELCALEQPDFKNREAQSMLFAISQLDPNDADLSRAITDSKFCKTVVNELVVIENSGREEFATSKMISGITRKEANARPTEVNTQPSGAFASKPQPVKKQ